MERVLKHTKSPGLTAQLLCCSKQSIYNYLRSYRAWLVSGQCPEITFEQWHDAKEFQIRDQLDSLRIEVRVLSALTNNSESRQG